MPKPEAPGLLMAPTDVDPAHEDAFNRWYDKEHIGRLLAIPGFLSAGRLPRLARDECLAMYELEDHNVLRSAAFIDTVRYQPSPRRLATSPSTHGRNFLLNGYRQIFPAPPPHPADNPAELPVLFADGPHRRHGVDGGRVQRLVRHLLCSGFLKVPGMIRARRFSRSRRNRNTSPSTSSKTPVCQRSKEWMAARDSDPWSRRVRAGMRLDEGSPAVFERIFPKDVGMTSVVGTWRLVRAKSRDGEGDPLPPPYGGHGEGRVMLARQQAHDGCAVSNSRPQKFPAAAYAIQFVLRQLHVRRRSTDHRRRCGAGAGPDGSDQVRDVSFEGG